MAKRFSLQVLVMLSLACVAQPTVAVELDQLSLVPIISELSQPVGIIHAAGDTDRLFIIEQDGVIQVFNVEAGTVNPTPFLDITSIIDSAGNEQGLLGLVFHSDYASNGYFYVNYTRDPGPGSDLTVISRFSVSAENSAIADENSEFKIMEIPQDRTNHNGGDLHFGSDGYLYIAVGDGGGSDDEFEHAQDINSLKGKMLRIDVDEVPAQKPGHCGLIQNYAIPAGNPFVGKEGCDEVWSYGLRNPWRFSFDRQTNDMYIGDVGQRLWEEVNFEPANTAGVNYGWSCREGAHNFVGGSTCDSASTDPILEYDHNNSRCSITGGYVYRGQVTAFNGYYFYADYCSKQIWLANKSNGVWQSLEWSAAASVLERVSSFGEDASGELYIADRSAGKVFRIQIEDNVVFADSFETKFQEFR